MNLNELTAHELLNLVQSKKTSYSEINQTLRETIKRIDPQVKAYVRISDANLNPSALPITIKDNICIQNTEKLAAMHRVRVEGYCAPAETLPFKDNEFDAIFGLGALHHFADLDLCMKEITRVL